MWFTGARGDNYRPCSVIFKKKLDITKTEQTQYYYDQLNTKNLDNLDELDKFQVTYKLPNLAQEETENLNKPIPSKEIKSVT